METVISIKLHGILSIMNIGLYLLEARNSVFCEIIRHF
jgi:hypothetical protein